MKSWRSIIRYVHANAPKPIAVGSAEDMRINTLGLVASVGEIAQAVMSYWRGDITVSQRNTYLTNSLASAQIWLFLVAEMHGIDLSAQMENAALAAAKRFKVTLPPDLRY